MNHQSNLEEKIDKKNKKNKNKSLNWKIMFTFVFNVYPNKNNKMKISILKKNFPIFILLLALFLFSCSNIEEMAQYDINGIIKDAATSVPLKNIRVIRYGTDYLLFSDTIYTDSLGKYSFNQTDIYSKNKTFTVKAEDIDGKLNHGAYTTQTINVTYKSSDWSFTSVNNKLQGSAITPQNFYLNASN